MRKILLMVTVVGVLAIANLTTDESLSPMATEMSEIGVIETQSVTHVLTILEFYVETSMDSLEKANLLLSPLLKIATLTLIVIALFAGSQVYTQYSHYGPSCLENIESFDYWLSKNDYKGAIVSTHRKRLQRENGSTSCSGTFRTDEGGYEDWQGNITELSNGEIVGGASIN